MIKDSSLHASGDESLAGRASDADLRKAASAFAVGKPTDGLLQLATSFGPFIAGCVLMYLAIPFSPWLTLALALPTGALLVRIFIVQHDCGHGVFHASKLANALTGRLCSLLTLTPYANWSRHHRVHHANWNNLDRDTGSDIYSSCLTVRAYRALSARKQVSYRLLRHPLVANVLLPPLIFLLLYRLPFDTPKGWGRERWSVYFTNLALAALFATLALLLGWRHVLLVHLSILAVTSVLGVWLFTLQHRFPAARWSGQGTWRFVEAALDGSSWFDLPSGLHWLTGNIGFHHVHHLDPRVPSYRLAAAHRTVQRLRPVAGLRFSDALRATRLVLWDEDAGRLVSFREARG